MSEKKDIAQLSFDVNDAINNLDKIDKKLESISKSSEAYAKRIGQNLSNFINVDNNINVEEYKTKLNKITGYMNEFGKKVKYTLSGNADFSKMIDINKFKKQLSNVNTLTKSQAKKMVSEIMSQELKITANKKVEAEKRLTYEKKANTEILTSEAKTADKKMLIDTEYNRKKELSAQNFQQKQELLNQKQLKSTQTLYNKINEYAKTYIIYQGFNQLRSSISETIEEMVKVEYQMVSIDRVLNDSSLNIDKYRDKLIQLAYDYGNSFENVADITLRLAQAGFNAQESLMMTEKTLLALNTAELDATQATEDMVAVMAQWGLMTGTANQQAEAYGNIIDKINKVADNYPTTSEDILEALKKTSSAFNLAGASIDETIATIVAAEKASQRGGKVIGTALSNIIQQLKAEGKLNLAEELGLDFFTDADKIEFKPIMEIFEEMSNMMQNLKDQGKESSVEMQSLLEMFTVFRRNIGASLLGEMSGEDSTYAQVLEDSLNSIGYSLQENEKHMQTAKAAQEQFNAELLKLKTEIWDNNLEDVFRSMLLLGENLVGGIKNLIETFGLVPIAVATAVLALSTFNKSLNIEGIKKGIFNIGELRTAINLFNEEIMTGKGDIKDFNKLIGNSVPESFVKYTNSIKQGEASLSKYILKTAAAKVGTIALRVSVAALEAAISFGITLAIQALIEVITNWINATEIASDKISDMNNNLETSKNSLSQYADEFVRIRTEMDDATLTQEEYNTMKNQLKTIEEELIKLYGNEASKIDLVTGSIKEQEQAIKDLSKQDYKTYIKENQKEIDKLTSELNKKLEKNLSLTDFLGQISDLENLKKILTDIEGVSSPDSASWVAISGNPEEVLNAYSEIYDKLIEYQNNNLNNMSDSDKEYLHNIIVRTSDAISELNKKYEEDLNTYKQYLNNKLQYDEFYSSIYGKILEARANLSKAIAEADPNKIEEAQNNINAIYKEAIEKAKTDPDVAKGMEDLLNEQLKNINESTDLEELKLKIGINSDEIYDNIQDILNDMGDIEFEDLKIQLGSEEETENIQLLKKELNNAGVSIDNFITKFNDLGFIIGETDKKVKDATKGWETYNNSINNNMNNLNDLASSYATLLTVQEQYNSKGYITLDMMNTLLANKGQLLQYLSFENGQLQINTQSMLNLAEAQKVAAIESLQQAAAEDINKAALGDVNNMSAIAKGAIAQFGDNAKTTGEKALTSANAIYQMAGALDAAIKAGEGNLAEGIDVDLFKRNANAIKNAYMEIAKGIGNINITSAKYNPQIASKSSGSSSSSNAAREAKQAANDAEKAAKEAYNNQLNAFKDYVDEKERLEQRWVNKQKELGQLSNKDFLYITQQRIERYKKYLEEVKNATWLNAEDRLALEKEYSEKIEDLQVDYIGYLQDQLDEEIAALEKANEEKIQLIEEEADAKIEALKKVQESTDRKREEEDYKKERQNILDEISYWEQRTGREAQEALKDAKEKLQELDDEWKEQLEDWSIEDQIAAIEEERDTQIQAIQDAQKAEIESMQAIYDEKVKLFAETGQIIYEGSVIQSQALYNAYKQNFIDPISAELANLNKVSIPTVPSTPTQQYETYTIKYGDTLSAIARRYGTTVDKIMAANPYITNKNKIYAGKTLQIPKFHDGGIFDGPYLNSSLGEGLAILKKGELILKPSHTASLERMMNYLDRLSSTNQTNITNGPTIRVSGDLIKIEADIKNKSDINYLEKRLERMLKDKFNIKK